MSFLMEFKTPLGHDIDEYSSELYGWIQWLYDMSDAIHENKQVDLSDEMKAAIMSVDVEHLTLQLVESSDGRFFVRFS